MSVSNSIILSTGDLRAVVDPGRGADILSIVDVASGRDAMFSTPWRRRADAIRAGIARPTAVSGQAQWLEQYRGGWQTLCPNAGPARSQDAAPYDFHGEASVAAWQVHAATESSAQLSVDLFSAPVRIRRELRLNGSTLTQSDVLTNLSGLDIQLDYVAHAAFGDGLLAEGASVRTDAQSFVADEGTTLPGGSSGTLHEWPWLVTSEGRRNLGVIDRRPARQRLFGWLQDFASGRVSIEGMSGLTVDLQWDARILPFAWVWQESESSEFPWFGRGRVLAIEPSSTPTSGAGRRRSLNIPAHGDVEVSLALTVRTDTDINPMACTPPLEETP